MLIGAAIFAASMLAALHLYVRQLVRLELERLIDLHDAVGSFDGPTRHRQ